MKGTVYLGALCCISGFDLLYYRINKYRKSPSVTLACAIDLSYNDVKCEKIHVTLNMIGSTFFTEPIKFAFDVIIRKVYWSSIHHSAN